MSFFRTWFPSYSLTHLSDLLWELIDRDMKIRYKNSVLGKVWTLAHPLLLLLVFHFIFRTVLEIDMKRFTVFAFSGLLVWSWFQSALIQSAGAITGSRDLVRRPGFPIGVLPIISVTTSFIHFLYSIPVLFLFLVLSDISIQPVVFLLPLVMGIQYGLTLGLGYFLAATNTLFRDIQHLLTVLLQLLFWLCPIIYDVSAIPEAYQTIYSLNPMVHLLEAYRDILLNGVIPNFSTLLGMSALSLLFLGAGIITFWRMRFRFVEVI